MLRVAHLLNCRRLLQLASAAALALAVIAGSNRALAAPPVPVGYELQISPYARVLDAVGSPDFMDVLWEESCDNPHLRVRARNKPAIMITNDGTSAGSITSFSLTINEGPYLFGTGDFASDAFDNFIKNTLYTDAGVLITSSSVSDGGKTLNVNFSGLDAGKKVIFNVDLDANDMSMFPFPDYRNILFGAPTDSAADPTDPATYMAVFTDLGSVAPNTTSLGGEFEQVLVPPTYQNDDIRPYRSMDKLEITVVTPQIPEPAGALLAAMALAGLAARRRVQLGA